MDYHSQPSFSTANSRKCIERDLKKRKSRRTAFDGVTIESVCAHAPTHKLNWTHTLWGRVQQFERTWKTTQKKRKGCAARGTRASRRKQTMHWAQLPSCLLHLYGIAADLLFQHWKNPGGLGSHRMPPPCYYECWKEENSLLLFFFRLFIPDFFSFFSLLPSSARPPISLILGDIKCDWE